MSCACSVVSRVTMVTSDADCSHSIRCWVPMLTNEKRGEEWKTAWKKNSEKRQRCARLFFIIILCLFLPFFFPPFFPFLSHSLSIRPQKLLEVVFVPFFLFVSFIFFPFAFASLQLPPVRYLSMKSQLYFRLGFKFEWINFNANWYRNFVWKIINCNSVQSNQWNRQGLIAKDLFKVEWFNGVV